MRMALEGIMLSDINQTKKNKYCVYHLYVESKTEQDKNIKLTEQRIEKWLPEARDAGEIERGW